MPEQHEFTAALKGSLVALSGRGWRAILPAQLTKPTRGAPRGTGRDWSDIPEHFRVRDLERNGTRGTPQGRQAKRQRSEKETKRGTTAMTERAQTAPFIRL